MSYKASQLAAWLDDVSGPGWLWHAKYIAANDTYAKPNVHQGGPYLAKRLLSEAFPELSRRAESFENPDLDLPVSLDSHQEQRHIRVVWYNSKVLTGRPSGRDEARMTRWGGKSSPLLAPEATGSLAIFAFRIREGEDADECRVWLCETAEETDLVLNAIGDVEPGQGVMYSPVGRLQQDLDSTGGCKLRLDELLPEWLEIFPSGMEIVRWVVDERAGLRSLAPDERLLRRRACEYEVFLSIEREHVLPRAVEGFQTVDEFIGFANAVTNRRKSRSGRSLELHLRRIFDEEGVPYVPQPQTEGSRTPDFLFPSLEAYRDSQWPAEKLRMLAAKTTCKDRWRQILNEAERVQPLKHLFTLQEGVSSEQHREMREEGVLLVVPNGNVGKFPDEVQAELLTLQEFIGEAKAIGTV